MMQALGLEVQKVKGRKVWLIVAAMIVVELLWSFWGVSDMDADELKQGWQMFLFQLPIINSIILPVVAAVVASRICDVEHKGQTFKLLETLMPAGRIFDAKFIFGGLYLCVGICVQVLAMILVGSWKGFSGAPPLKMFAWYFVFTAAVSLTILLLQQILSLQFPNQMVSLSVGLLGGLVGIFLLYLPKVFSKFFLWGYFGELLFVQMDWNPATRIVRYATIPKNWPGFLLLVGAFIVLYIFGRRAFIRKEI
ncbi:MAG: lantibiotic transport system permease protein [Chloroflexota bacterium]|nr:lantibiotic transport system permease protein [Chloroflexota bacterium]